MMYPKPNKKGQQGLKHKVAQEKAVNRASGAQGEVRIIGGQWKRTRLSVMDMPGLRPTPARVRETLFNWLGQDLSGWRCLDAFAGSGALGFEAASRGAQQVMMVEKDRRLAAHLRTVQSKLEAQQVQVVCADALSILLQCEAASMDVIFLDPPFAADLFDEVLRLAACVVASHGAIYLEADRAIDAPVGLSCHRQAKAAAVYYYLFVPDRA